MSDAQSLDVRVPIGALFALLGALLVGYGATHREARVDLWWGMVLAVFGLIMLALARARGEERK